MKFFEFEETKGLGDLDLVLDCDLDLDPLLLELVVAVVASSGVVTDSTVAVAEKFRLPEGPVGTPLIFSQD